MQKDRKERKRHRLRWAVVCAAALITLSILTWGVPLQAKDLKVIHGIVRTVSGSRIFMGEKSFNLAGATIRNPEGKNIAVSEIKAGTKVGLYYRRGRLTSVLVYPAMLE
jgi:hypothetical protein